MFSPKKNNPTPAKTGSGSFLNQWFRVSLPLKQSSGITPWLAEVLFQGKLDLWHRDIIFFWIILEKIVVAWKSFYWVLYSKLPDLSMGEPFFPLFYLRRKLIIYLGNSFAYIVLIDFYVGKKHGENIFEILNCSILCILVDPYQGEFLEIIE